MKIKYVVIQKLHMCSLKEWDLFLYVAKCMDQATGEARGVYYRDVMQACKMSKQSFYNALRGLYQKGIITYQKNSELDYDVTILDNYFVTEMDYQDGYVSLSREAFLRPEFQKLKAHEKYMLFEFLKGTHENGHSLQMGRKKFYEKFRDILGVTNRVIRSYLHNLKYFFSIGVKDGKIYITYKHSIFRKLKKGDKGYKTEMAWYIESRVKTECHRCHVSYDSGRISDTASLIGQYREKLNYKVGNKSKELLRIVLTCLHRTVEGLRWKDRELNPRYIHKLLRTALDLDQKHESNQEEPQGSAT